HGLHLRRFDAQLWSPGVSSTFTECQMPAADGPPQRFSVSMRPWASSCSKPRACTAKPYDHPSWRRAVIRDLSRALRAMSMDDAEPIVNLAAEKAILRVNSASQLLSQAASRKERNTSSASF